MVLEKLTSTLFEAIFFTTVFGIIFSLFTVKSSPQNKYSRALIVLLGIMISWRFFIAQVSSRYWVAIVIPAFLISNYFFYFSEFGRRIARILVILTVIVCIGKDLHFNWNDKSIIKLAAIIKEDAKKYRSVLCTELEEDAPLLPRIGYYTDFPILKNNLDNHIEIHHIYESAKGLYDVLYLVAEKSEMESAFLTKNVAEFGGILLASFYKDMHKKKKVYLYKITIPPKKQLDYTQIELLPNGDFEKIVKHNNPQNAHFIPYKWRVSKDVIIDDSIESINGNRSLSTKYTIFSSIYSTQVNIPSTNKLLVFRVKNALRASLYVRCYYYDSTGAVTVNTLMSIIVPDNDLHQFQIPLSTHVSPDSRKMNLGFFFTAPNGFIIDDIGFYSLAK